MSGRAQPDPAFADNAPTAVSSTRIVASFTGSAASAGSSSTSTSLTTSASSSTVSSLTSSSTSASKSISSSSSATNSSTTTTSTTAATSTTSTSKTASSISTSFYPYRPSLPLPLLFTALYALQIPYHFYLSIYVPYIRKSVTQKHAYTIPLFAASCLSTLGYTLRTISVHNEISQRSILLYATSQCSIIIAPLFICATLYLLLAHLIQLCLPEGQQRVFLGLNPKALGRIFIASDVLAFLCQGGGSGIAASAGWKGNKAGLGRDLLVLGLGVQVVSFTLFLGVLGLFCKRVGGGNKDGKGKDGRRDRGMSVSAHVDVNGGNMRRERDYGFNPLVKQVIKGMWIASVLIEIRSIFRTIEFAMGANRYLFVHEWPLWVFDAAPIWIALMVLGIHHPTKWLQQRRRSQFVDKYNRDDGRQSGLPN